jgi:WD40 repeat protein
LWDTRTWRQIRVFADADFHCWVGTISDDGSRIALGSRDWRVRVENINTCEAPIEFDDLGGVTSDMVFAPDGKTLIAAALNGRTRIWTLDGTRRAGALDCDRSEIARLRLAPDGRTVILSQRNGRATGCDVETGAAVFTIPTTERRVRSADFSPDASSIVYGTWSGAVAIANIARARTMLTIDAHTEVVRDIRWSPDGRYIATVAGEGSVKLWDATNGLYLLSLGEGRSTSQSPSETSGPTNFIFIPNSKRVVITYDDGRIEVWDLGAFDHHIAGNVEQFLAKLGPELGDKVDAERVRTWARTLTKN